MNKEQLVSIPQEIADWIESNKQTTSLYGAMKNTKSNEKVDSWMTSPVNQETFALAWISGYTIEKEKKYLVKLKNIQALFCYLARSNHLDYWSLSCSKMDGFTTIHTRRELEEAGFGEVFYSSLFEVQEVK